MSTSVASRRIVSSIIVSAASLMLFLPAASAQDHWVATWAASPQAGRGGGPARAGATTPPPPSGFNDQTVRMVVRTSIGGKRARVQLSNSYGTTPLTVGGAHIALRDKDSAIIAGSDKALTFSGKTSFTIPPEADIVSDPVDLDVPKLGDLMISVYVPGEVPAPTSHATGLHTTYISKAGDFTGAASITDPTTTNSWYLISGVDVIAPADSRAIVAFGDSITDGATSTPDTNSSWPSQLAQRLLANKATAKVAIVNEGISGNRVLSDGPGVSALARFDRDVLAQPGIEWVVFMEGINDVGLYAKAAKDPLTADQLIAAHKQIIERAHLRGIKVIGATLTPFAGASYYSEEGEAIRVALNEFIRTGKAYDAVIDFDAAVRDPQNPKQILPAFNIRDHLHPNDAGYKAMAEAVDLSIFTGGKSKK